MKKIFLIFQFMGIISVCFGQQGIIIDGVKKSAKDLEKLDSSAIFSYTVFPPDNPPQWCNWLEKKQIIVKTKKVEEKLQIERHRLLNQILDSSDQGKNVLIVKNGLLVNRNSFKALRNLSPDQLSNAKLMDWKEAKNLYGSKAREITLVINTYLPVPDE